MFRGCVLWWLCGLTTSLQAQIKDFSLKAQYIEGNSKVLFYAKNPGVCPIQVQISLSNPEIVADPSLVRDTLHFVVASRLDSVVLLVLPILTETGKNLWYSHAIAYGNPAQAVDDDFQYQLPYRQGKTKLVTQGYNGRFSHQGEYALDIKMRTGTQVCAARGGVVLEARGDSQRGGGDASFADDANYVKILHSDGTTAIYYHLKYEGALVGVGEQVVQGQVIALSGSTGWSTAPHLHFSVKRPMWMEEVSMPTLFKSRKAEKPRSIKPWRLYKSF